MTMKNKLAVGICLALCSGTAFSAAKVADGRGNGMGNTGVASADYLVAPFYNPALVGVFRANDDVGLLLPAFELSARDSGETLTDIEDVQDAIDQFEGMTVPDASTINELNTYLDNITDDAPLAIHGGLGAAIAIPNNLVAANLFASAHVEVVAHVRVADYVSDSVSDTETRYEDTEVDLVAFGYSELGLALAKQFVIADQPITFGISPKVQKLQTYAYNVRVENFDEDDYEEDETTKSALNLDVGAVWTKNDMWRVGFAIKDLIKQSIDVTDDDEINGTYELTPQATVAAAYSSRFFTAAVDVDLTKQTRFEGFTDLSDDFDDTQFIRFGLEGNAWDWLQLRAGYEIDIQDTMDNTITAGVGVSPFDVVSLDIAVSYADENQMGGSANLAFTF